MREAPPLVVVTRKWSRPEPGDRAVVDDHAVLVQHQAVSDAALVELCDAVDVEAVEELRGVGARDLDLAERRGVEQADAGAHGGCLALRRLVHGFALPRIAGGAHPAARFPPLAPSASCSACAGSSRRGA